MKLSQKESTLALVTLAVVLYCGGYLFVSPKIAGWQKLRDEQSLLVQKIETEKELLKEKEKWDREFGTLKKNLPVKKMNEPVDVFWMRKIYDIAKSRNVDIQIQALPEKKAGELYELPLVCTKIQGSLPDLIRFFFDLQADGAVIDVRDVTLQPVPQGGGKLAARSMNVYCAYLKE